MWEDEANIRGGRWMISLSKQQRFTDLNTLWLDVVSEFAFKFVSI